MPLAPNGVLDPSCCDNHLDLRGGGHDGLIHVHGRRVAFPVPDKRGQLRVTDLAQVILVREAYDPLVDEVSERGGTLGRLEHIGHEPVVLRVARHAGNARVVEAIGVRAVGS